MQTTRKVIDNAAPISILLPNQISYDSNLDTLGVSLSQRITTTFHAAASTAHYWSIPFLPNQSPSVRNFLHLSSKRARLTTNADKYATCFHLFQHASFPWKFPSPLLCPHTTRQRTWTSTETIRDNRNKYTIIQRVRLTTNVYTFMPSSIIGQILIRPTGDNSVDTIIHMQNHRIKFHNTTVAKLTSGRQHKKMMQTDRTVSVDELTNDKTINENRKKIGWTTATQMNYLHQRHYVTTNLTLTLTHNKN